MTIKVKTRTMGKFGMVNVVFIKYDKIIEERPTKCVILRIETR